MLEQTDHTNNNLTKDAYISFDALTLRQKIVDRLNEKSGFTDQNYVGSNLASIIDIISYAYNTLIFYLNRTATESMFTEAQIYENVNRIVKILDYKPLGFQTSVVPYSLTFFDEFLEVFPGVYTIPRYSYVKTQTNLCFSFNEDITFARNLDVEQQLTELINKKFLLQGIFKEYDQYIASGITNEKHTLLLPESTLIDHHNIHVYVKHMQDPNQRWVKYSSTPSLYLENGRSTKYEIRLNGNKQYEITFGDDINARQLSKGDIVCVYYLVSNGDDGVIVGYTLDGNRVVRFNTPNFQDILRDTARDSIFLTDQQVLMCRITNSTSSSYPQPAETVEEIKKSAPAAYRSQYRLVVEEDYINFIKSNFNNIITDITVMNNTDYMSSYIKYFYDLGVENPIMYQRALYNQFLFGSSCNFNNIYITIVPKFYGYSVDYLSPTQKQYIKSIVDSTKVATVEIMFVDPIYIALAIGITDGLVEEFNVYTEAYSKIHIIKSYNNKRSSLSIKHEVKSVFLDYFKQTNCKLGQTINVREIEQKILNIDGVDGIKTVRTDIPTVSYGGLSMFAWNTAYDTQDRMNSSGNIMLEPFKFPYLYDIDRLDSKIEVV